MLVCARSLARSPMAAELINALRKETTKPIAAHRLKNRPSSCGWKMTSLIHLTPVGADRSSLYHKFYQPTGQSLEKFRDTFWPSSTLSFIQFVTVTCCASWRAQRVQRNLTSSQPDCFVRAEWAEIAALSEAPLWSQPVSVACLTFRHICSISWFVMPAGSRLDCLCGQHAIRLCIHFLEPETASVRGRVSRIHPAKCIQPAGKLETKASALVLSLARQIHYKAFSEF